MGAIEQVLRNRGITQLKEFINADYTNIGDFRELGEKRLADAFVKILDAV